MTTVSGLVGLAAQTPVGAAIDTTNAKRGVVLVFLAGLALGAIVIFLRPTFWPVLIANSALSVVGDVFGPAIAALTLDLYLQRQLPNRMGRNGAFDHGGNVAAIDHDRARGAGQDDGAPRESWGQLFANEPLVAFGASLVLFHFANAPLLPLAGQKLAQRPKLTSKIDASAMPASAPTARRSTRSLSSSARKDAPKSTGRKPAARALTGASCNGCSKTLPPATW